MGSLMCLDIGYEVSVFGFMISFIPFVTRQMGVSTRQGIGLRMMGYQHESSLFVIIRD